MTDDRYDRPRSTRRSNARRSSSTRSVMREGGSTRTSSGTRVRRSGSGRSGSSRQARRPSAQRGPSTQRGYAYGGSARNSRSGYGRRRQSSGLLPLLILALVLVVAFGIHRFLRLGVTVNGEKMTVWRGTTVEKLLDKEVVNPTPGDLLAIDGSIITEGGGERCSVEIDGEAADVTSKLKRKASVNIGDGADVTEDSTVSEESIPYGTADDSREFGLYWSGSIHLLSDGQEGVRTVTTGSVSGITLDEVTKPAIDSGYRIYTARPADKVIALTFDDGPWEGTTSEILDILEQYGARATFFTIGNQISSYPDEVRRAKALGCQVCTHTWDHAAGSGQGVNLTYMSASEQIDEIQRGYNAISEVLGEEPSHIMRAPGGNFYGDIISTLWPYVDAEIGWDVDTEDWRLPGADAIAAAITSAQPGQVVLMHDGGGDRSQTVAALRQAMPVMVEQGYSFITIDEMLAYGVPDQDAAIDVG